MATVRVDTSFSKNYSLWWKSLDKYYDRFHPLKSIKGVVKYVFMEINPIATIRMGLKWYNEIPINKLCKLN